MSLNLDDKKTVVAEVSAEVAHAQSIIVAEYRGLEVVDLTALRANARKSGVYLRVVKNTLVRRAIAGTPFEGLSGKLAGPLIYGISKDPVAAAKLLNDFAKGNDKLAIKVGAMPNYVMDAAGVKALATISSRPNSHQRKEQIDLNSRFYISGNPQSKRIAPIIGVYPIPHGAPCVSCLVFPIPVSGRATCAVRFEPGRAVARQGVKVGIPAVLCVFFNIAVNVMQTEGIGRKRPDRQCLHSILPRVRAAAVEICLFGADG